MHLFTSDEEVDAFYDDLERGARRKFLKQFFIKVTVYLLLGLVSYFVLGRIVGGLILFAIVLLVIPVFQLFSEKEGGEMMDLVRGRRLWKSVISEKSIQEMIAESQRSGGRAHGEK